MNEHLAGALDQRQLVLADGLSHVGERILVGDVVDSEVGLSDVQDPRELRPPKPEDDTIAAPEGGAAQCPPHPSSGYDLRQRAGVMNVWQPGIGVVDLEPWKPIPNRSFQLRPCV